jgi:type III secretion system YscC/HrcC family outer membrane pore protein
MLFKRILVFLTVIILPIALLYQNVQANVIVLNNTLITDFFDGVSIEIDKPIVVSKRAELFKITGEIDLTDVYGAIDNVANKTGLVWYDNGTAIYVYSKDELRSEFIPIYTKKDFNEIVNYLKLADLYDSRYPIRYTKGAGFVSGTPLYVNIVRDAVNAFYVGEEKQQQISEINKKAAEENQQLLAQNQPREVIAKPDMIKVFRLHNRFVSDMKYRIRGEEKIVPGALTVLKSLLTDAGITTNGMKIVSDPLNNSIYVKGDASEVRDVEALLKEVDLVREQIQLSLWIIDIDTSEISDVGTSVEGLFKNDLIQLGLNGGSSIILNPSQTVNFIGKINVLEEDKKAKVLSRPILITQNNTPAVIDTNETIYVRLLGEQEVALQEITYGTILSVTPRVVRKPNGSDIEMMVEIEDGNQTSDLIDGIPNIRRSLVSTMGRIRDSESLLLGGFVRKEVTEQNRGIPILKDIPILKYMFSVDVHKTSNVMRLFMIEPKIVRDPESEFDRRRIINLQSEAFIQPRITNKARQRPVRPIRRQQAPRATNINQHVKPRVSLQSARRIGEAKKVKSHQQQASRQLREEREVKPIPVKTLVPVLDSIKTKNSIVSNTMELKPKTVTSRPVPLPKSTYMVKNEQPYVPDAIPNQYAPGSAARAPHSTLISSDERLRLLRNQYLKQKQEANLDANY